MKQEISVLTFNVLHHRWANEYKEYYSSEVLPFPLLDRKSREEASIKYINSQDCNVVLLQEVGTEYLQNLDHTQWIVGPLISPMIKGVRQEEGVAILVNRKFWSEKKFMSFNGFQCSDNEERENVAVCLIDDIAFVCAHGEWASEGKVTSFSRNFWGKLDALMKNVCYKTNYRVIAGGDWNFEPGTEAFKLMEEQSTAKFTSDGPTFLGKPPQSLDHFFMKKMIPTRINRSSETTTLKDCLQKFGSDHMPVIAFVEASE